MKRDLKKEKDLLKRLRESADKVEKFNTCNAWGFGGGIGKQYTKGRLRLREGTAYFRHLSSEHFCRLYLDGKEVDPSKDFEEVEKELSK